MFKQQLDILFTAFLIFCVCEITSPLTIEELKPLYYEVDILQTPIKKGEKQSQPSVYMKSKYGQEYECRLPVVEDDEVSKKESLDNDKNVDIKELLKPIQSGSCLLKVQDWWTYELCPGHYIKQFHIEDGHILGQVITLGIYESDYDWTNDTNKEKFKHVTNPYHSQWYVNGTKCDLTGQPRNAEVRMFCEPDAGDYIFRVDELETCSYIITIHTSRICSYPPLKPTPPKKAHTIPCHPILSEEQYNKYTKKVNEEKLLADQKRSEWLNNQQERLKVMKKENLQQLENEKLLKSTSDVDNNDVELNKDAVPDKENADRVEKTFHEEIADQNAEEAVETFLVQEYDREIEKLKSFLSPDKFTTVKNSIQKHFDTILSEAEDEQNPELSAEAKEASLQKLTSTLNMLLKKLDIAEKDAVKANDELNKESAFLSETHQVSSEITVENDDISEMETEDRNDDLIEEGSVKTSDDEYKQNSMLDDDELHVRIRRLDRKLTDANGKLYEMDFNQRKKLEQAVKEKLEKSGLDTGGRRIEVKIITAGYYNNEDGKDLHILTDEETSQFQNMIMALLTGQQEAVQEMERHKKLEESYQFNWEKEEEKDD